MWRQTVRLLWVRLRMARNHFIRPGTGRLLQWVLAASVGALFLCGEYVFFHRIIRHLDGLPLNVGDELLVQMLNVVFLTLFAMILFSSLISSLNIFYLSADLDFVHSLPLRPEPVIVVRFLQNLAQSALMVVIFSAPIFIAYGDSFNLGAGYYAYLMTAFPPFVVIPCACGTLAMMLLMRYFPTRKTHQILSFTGLLFVIGLVVYLRFLSPEKFFGKEVSDEAIIAFVESLRAPDYGFLPSSWITNGLSRWREGHPQTAYRQLGYLVLATCASIGILYEVSRHVYLTGWRQIQELNSAPVRKSREGSRIHWLWDCLPVSQASRALLAKDIKIFFRDPGQWSQLFILFALVVVYVFNIVNLPVNNPVYGLGFRSVISVLNVGLIGFVLSAIIVRFVFTSVSIEGLKMWTVYTAPVDMRSYLRLKFLMSFPPLLLLAESLAVVSNLLLGVDRYVMTVSVLGVLMLTFGLTGMGVGMAALYPRFQYENVTEISSGPGGILYMISSLMYVGAMLALWSRPMFVHFSRTILMRDAGGSSPVIFYALMILVTLAAAWIPCRRGVRNMESMDL